MLTFFTHINVTLMDVGKLCGAYSGKTKLFGIAFFFPEVACP